MPKTLKEVEKKNSYCAQCGSCCPIICHLKDGRFFKVVADRLHPNSTSICPKGVAGPELVYSQERLKYPMRRTRPKGDDPAWERITWDKAFDIIGTRISEIKTRFGAESVAFGRAGVAGSPFIDLSVWVARLSRAFGSPNFMTTGYVCQWHRDTASNYTYGQGGIGTPEFERAACILIWGHNPHDTSRSNLRDIKKGRKQGAKLVVVDPRQTELAAQADLWLQLKPGTDCALALGVMQVILDERLYDGGFCRDWTNGPFLVRSDNGNFLTPADINESGDYNNYMVWDANSNHVKVYDTLAKGYEDDLQVLPSLEGSYKIRLYEGREIECQPAFQLLKEVAAHYPPKRVETITGVPGEMIVSAARLLATTKPLCYFSFNGIEQHTNASQTNRALCVLYTLTGSYGAPGGNVVYPKMPTNPIDGLEFLTPDTQQKGLGFLERPLGPARGGKIRAADLYQAILMGKPYPIKALVCFGGNPITANAESLTGREALKNLDFYVQTELFLTPAAQLADIVLPASSFYESRRLRVSFPTPRAHSHIQLCSPVVDPQYESRPDLEIMFKLAQRLGLGDRFWHGSISAAFDYILAPSGVTRRQLERSTRGISLGKSVEHWKYREIDPKTGNPRGFGTHSGRIEIYSQVFKDYGYDPLPAHKEPELRPSQKYPFILICAKVLPFCHGQHRSLPSLRKAIPYPFLEINATKANELGIQHGDWVILESPRGSIELKAKLTLKIAPDVVCTQHGWWQPCPELNLPGFDPYSLEGANVNLLYSNEPADPLSGSLLYKGYPCNVRRL